MNERFASCCFCFQYIFYSAPSLDINDSIIGGVVAAAVVIIVVVVVVIVIIILVICQRTRKESNQFSFAFHRHVVHSIDQSIEQIVKLNLS